MRPHVVFVLGPSGAGKTALVRHLVGFPRVEIVKDRWTIGDHFIAAGPYRGHPLDGPDSMPFAPPLLRKMIGVELQEMAGGRPVLLDGTRFAVAWAIDALRERADISAMLLDADPSTLERRRASRGSPHVDSARLRAQADTARRVATSIGRVRQIDTNSRPADVMRDVLAALA